MVNAWKLHCLVAKCKDKKQLSQVHFKVMVTEGLLLIYVSEAMEDDDKEFERPRQLPYVSFFVKLKISLVVVNLKDLVNQPFTCARSVTNVFTLTVFHCFTKDFINKILCTLYFVHYVQK